MARPREGNCSLRPSAVKGLSWLAIAWANRPPGQGGPVALLFQALQQLFGQGVYPLAHPILNETKYLLAFDSITEGLASQFAGSIGLILNFPDQPDFPEPVSSCAAGTIVRYPERVNCAPIYSIAPLS